ncbi:MAG: protein-glutamate O-methyltransferase CheR [Alphaproteobacteria bacterium]|nr:protein-glutamate O-methyltransferase CheR [Alphaproteobacteria bacterium]
MPDHEFQFIAREIRARSGLVLTPDKSYLLETRLAPIARKEGFASVLELISAVRVRRDDRLLWVIADALTTNETFFFRDKTPFDQFRDLVVPDLMKARPPGARLRIWCAACSSGQEPYSLAMLVQELRAVGKIGDVEIVATDISDRVMEKARAGLYSQFEVQRGLPVQMLVKHFEKAGDLWRLSERIRSMVRFQRHNLLEDARVLGKFDIVYCRNVLIYFEGDAKRRTLEMIAGTMAEDGVLFLGAAETTLGITDAFASSPDRRGLYRRVAGWRRAA